MRGIATLAKGPSNVVDKRHHHHLAECEDLTRWFVTSENSKLNHRQYETLQY